MTEIRFYQLQTQSQDQALPLLLSKALERGMRVVLKLADESEVERMNDILWTYAPESFLPHGSKKDGRAELQPIWLTNLDENPNKATALFIGQGACAENLESFDLCCEIFDGYNNTNIANARERWKAYKDKGFTVTYWQQNERGGWEQKA